MHAVSYSAQFSLTEADAKHFVSIGPGEFTVSDGAVVRARTGSLLYAGSETTLILSPGATIESQASPIIPKNGVIYAFRGNAVEVGHGGAALALRGTTTLVEPGAHVYITGSPVIVEL